jgi:4-alpha-glucanotransferase
MRSVTRARARRHGVITEYRSADGTRRTVDEATVLAVLDAIGADAPDPVLDPVTVAWDDDRPYLRTGATTDPATLTGAEVVLRSDAGVHTTLRIADCTLTARSASDAPDIVLPRALAPGAYIATLVGGAADGATTTILAAPRRLPRPTARRWGVFAPVSGLHDDSGRADLGCLDRLAAWAGRAGAAVVGTLPLLATFLDEPCEPSPYVPVSRRWWNELYVDLAAVPELAGQPRPEAVGTTHLDHRATMAARRRALESAATRVRGARQRAVQRFEADHPEVQAYARFRATVELHGTDPHQWPERARHQQTVVDEARERYHRYVQFLLDEQLRGIGNAMRARGQSLYLDLPVGTHPAGFDVFRAPDAFARGATTGAPPDRFFAAGQNWGFRPPHPVGARTHGYRDLRQAVARHLEVADVLRLDHVMGLERLWWVPDGADAADGAYVRYPMEELFAVLSVEATKASAAIVGEDLGTVSPTVKRALARHRIAGMYVGQFEVDVDATPAVATPPRRCVASLDTHDTATFAGFWTGTDVDHLAATGVLGADDARTLRAERAGQRVALAAALLGHPDGGDPGTTMATQRAVLRAWLAALASGPAELVLVTLEDLWLEPDPQNVPGTTDAQHRNWSRFLARPLEVLDRDADVTGALGPLADLRSTIRC